MTDFKLAGIVSAVGLGLGYLLGGRSSKVMEAAQGGYIISYLESHDEAKNQHKYYLLLQGGKDNYTAYGRLPGFGRGVTMKLDKQPSASKMNELLMKKMNTYQLVGHKYDQIPSEIRAKLENEIGMKSSSPSAEPKQEEKNPSAGMNARQRIFMKRRGLKRNAETRKIPTTKVVVIDGEEYRIEIDILYGYGWDGSQLSYQQYKKIMSYDLNIPIQSKNGNSLGENERKEIEDWLKRKFNPKKIWMDGDSRRYGKTTENYNTIWFILNDKVLEFFGIKIPSKKDCSKGHTWSNAYIRNDYGLDDDGTASVEYGQRCELCDVERRGSIGGDVLWDKNAETFEADMSVGNEMLRQLGGRRFMMMVGAKQPIWDGDKNELHMKIGRNALGANYFVIRLNPRDLYDLRFESRRMNRKTYEMSVKVKAEYDDVYADQLQDIFEKATGLYVRMAESFDAEYQPDQEIGDYSVAEIAKSSAIEGYQPNKYSFGPIGYGAESISSLKLKKDSCCCGATKKTPCVCMILGSDCSAKKPMCACYRLKGIQQKDEKGAETFETKGGKRMYCPNCKTNRTWNRGFKKRNLDYSKGERPRDFIFYVCQKCNYAYDPKTGKEIVGDWRKMFGYDAESTDSIPKPNPADKEEAFAWVKREHPHIKTDADREMEGVDYAAMTYHPEELEAGAINALKAGDFEAAERFVKALNRQNFIKAFQAEKNR